MYRRFVFLEGYVHGRHRPGIIRGLADRRYWKRRCSKCSLSYRALFDWLNEHLPRPPRDVFENGKALCWFRSDADVCLERMITLAGIHRQLGARVQELVHEAPGRVTYQDEFQIVAVPGPTLRFRPVREVVS